MKRALLLPLFTLLLSCGGTTRAMISSYQSSIDKTNERIDALRKSVPKAFCVYS